MASTIDSKTDSKAIPFELIPAIDLLEGNAVRLSQGRYDAATVYDSDPANVAQGFRDAGIRRLHVVDLEGAKALREQALASDLRNFGEEHPKVAIRRSKMDLQMNTRL